MIGVGGVGGAGGVDGVGDADGASCGGCRGNVSCDELESYTVNHHMTHTTAPLVSETAMSA